MLLQFTLLHLLFVSQRIFGELFTAMGSSNVPPKLLKEFPALASPLGVRPNFVNPPCFGPAINILGGILLPLAILAVSVRVFIRGTGKTLEAMGLE